MKIIKDGTIKIVFFSKKKTFPSTGEYDYKFHKETEKN